MNLTDLCPEGIEKWAEYTRFDWVVDYLPVHPLITVAKQLRVKADQAYLEHVRDCELCGGQDE